MNESTLSLSYAQTILPLHRQLVEHHRMWHVYMHNQVNSELAKKRFEKSKKAFVARLRLESN
jgi:hypothetical protein